MKDNESVNEAEKMWPNVVKVITDREAILDHMNDWCRDREAGADGVKSSKDELRTYLAKRLMDVPKTELADALAEHCAATVINLIVQHVQKEKGGGHAQN